MGLNWYPHKYPLMSVEITFFSAFCNVPVNKSMNKNQYYPNIKLYAEQQITTCKSGQYNFMYAVLASFTIVTSQIHSGLKYFWHIV